MLRIIALVPTFLILSSCGESYVSHDYPGLAEFRSGDARGAFEVWMAVEDRDDGVADYFLGKSYLHGIGVSPDETKSEEHFRIAADAGHPTAMAYAGSTASAEGDRETALLLLEAAAELKHPAGLTHLALALRQDDASPEDLALSQALVEQAVKMQYPRAQALLASWIQDSDPKEAAKLYRASASQGYTPAFVMAAMKSTDMAERYKWATLASEVDYGSSSMNVAGRALLLAPTPPQFEEDKRAGAAMARRFEPIMRWTDKFDPLSKSWATAAGSMPPMLVATGKGYTSEVERLLRAGNDPNQRGWNGWAPLHIAVEKENLNIVELLLTHSADPHTTGRDGYKAIHLAARSGNENIIDILLENGADIHAANDSGLSIFDTAASEDRVGILKRFAEKATPVERDQALRTACRLSQWASAEELLNQGGAVDLPDSTGLTALHYAANRSAGPRVFEAILATGVDPDTRGHEGIAALHLALTARNQSGVRLLLSEGDNVNIAANGGWAPIHFAVLVGDIELLRQIIDAGADVNMQTLAAMQIGSGSLDEMVETDVSSYEGLSPLHLAVLRELTFATRLLLASGANANLENAEGKTAKDLAIEMDNDLSTLF